MIVGGIAYLVSPFDIIPEAIFGVIGLVDDILIILMVIYYIAQQFRRILINRNQ